MSNVSTESLIPSTVPTTALDSSGYTLWEYEDVLSLTLRLEQGSN